MPNEKPRQVDAPNMLPALVVGAQAVFAHELRIDPVAACTLDFGRFSVKNPFHALASDARAMAIYLAQTGFGIPVADLAAGLGLPKQVVSRLCHRVEDLRDNPAQRRIIERVEKIYGISS